MEILFKLTLKENTKDFIEYPMSNSIINEKHINYLLQKS